MRTFRKKYPVVASVLVLLMTALGSVLGTVLLLLVGNLWSGLYHLSEYTIQLLAELVILALLVGITFLLRLQRVFTRQGKGFLKSVAPGAAILVIYLITGLEMLILSMEDPLRGPGAILCFVLCMAAIGVTEELAFRGLITEMIFEKYGKNPVGVWFTVVVSGLLFGAMHLINAVGGEIPLEGVLIQMVVAAMLGMCLSAIYLRGRNLWAVAALHGFMDFCALLSSGIFDAGSIADSIGSYSPANLVGGLFYLGVALFLLRRYHMQTLIVTEENDKPTVIKLGIAVGLLSAMTGAILVLTL